VPYWEPANLDVPTVADWIAYVADQVISQVTSGTRPPGTFAQFIGESDTGRIQAHNGTAFAQFGGLTAAATNSYTPQLDQGATTNIAKTMNYSQWQQYGNMALWHFTGSISAAGTAGSQVTLTTPVTLTSQQPGLGVGMIYDASTTTRYTGMWIGASTTQIRFFTQVVGASAWGVTPNLALANTDALHGVVWLPVA